MSRFNEATTTTEPDTVNRAGGEAYQQSPKQALVETLNTSFLQEQYYRSIDETVDDIRHWIGQISDPKFAAKAALSARHDFGMRTTSHVVAGEVGCTVRGEEWTKDFFHRIAARPDDMTEIAAYISGRLPGNKTFAHVSAARKGFARKLEELDEYLCYKYRQKGKEWSLVDLVNVCHPEPTEALTKLMNGTLEPADTWEVQLADAGRSDERSKEEVWTDLIEREKLGYQALVMNVRNIAQDAPNALPQALSQITGEERVRKSRMLPFRFLTALEAINEAEGIESKDRQRIRDALNDALEVSFDNVPEFEGKTAVALDHSGSMRGEYREPSLFAAVLVKSQYADVYPFTSTAQFMSVNASDSLTTIRDRFPSPTNGTDVASPLEVMKGRGREYDRIIYLSDQQDWAGYKAPWDALNEYKQMTGADPYVYSINTNAYGDMAFPKDQVVALAGLNEAVFDFVTLNEAPDGRLVESIENINLE